MVEPRDDAGAPPPPPPAEGAEAGPEAGAREKGTVASFFHKLALTSVGAFVLAQEEIEQRVRRILDRGEGGEGGEAPPAGEDQAADAAAREARGAEAPAEEPERRPLASQIDATITKVLHSLNLPSRHELAALHEQLDALEERLRKLR